MDWVTNPKYPIQLYLDDFQFLVFYHLQKSDIAPKITKWAYSIGKKKIIIFFNEGTHIYREGGVKMFNTEIRELLKSLHSLGLHFSEEIDSNDFMLYRCRSIFNISEQDRNRPKLIPSLINPEKVSFLPIKYKLKDELMENDQQMIDNLLGIHYEWITMEQETFIVYLKATELGLSPEILDYKIIEYRTTNSDKQLKFRVKVNVYERFYITDRTKKLITKKIRYMHVMGIFHGNVTQDSIVLKDHKTIMFLDWDKASFIHPKMTKVQEETLWKKETEPIKELVVGTDLDKLYNDKIIERKDEQLAYELGSGGILLPDRAVWN